MEDRSYSINFSVTVTATSQEEALEFAKDAVLFDDCDISVDGMDI